MHYPLCAQTHVGTTHAQYNTNQMFKNNIMKSKYRELIGPYGQFLFFDNSNKVNRVTFSKGRQGSKGCQYGSAGELGQASWVLSTYRIWVMNTPITFASCHKEQGHKIELIWNSAVRFISGKTVDKISQ